ncbi:MAG: arginine--tRNA ligase, partial [Patescibacteria group bacterium]
MDNTNQISNLKSQISKMLENSVKELVNVDIEAQVVVSSDLSKGDLTTNIAMATFRNAKSQMSNIKLPMEFAEKIAENLKLDIGNLKFLDRVEVKAPGFINFWLSQPQIIKQVDRVLDEPKDVDLATNSSLIFEFGDPNPFKEPHIGHVRNFTLGEAICRLNETNGVKVLRASYQGDVGMHVAKAIWGMIKLGFDTVENSSLEKRAEFLGKAYSTGAQAFENDETAKKDISEINKKIYSATAKASADKQNDTDIYSLWQKGRKISLDHFENLYEKLGIKYDKYYFESQTAPVGREIVEKYVPGVFETDAGAIVFRGEEFGLHTRVFVNSEGHATYEAKDLALAVMKDKDFPDANRSIIMTANEQVDYFKVLLSALKLVNPKIADKTSHLSFGFVNLKEGKMSSRKGNVVTAGWLFEETKNRLKKGFKEVSDDVLEQVSVGAVKWSMLKFSRESNISFSIEESVQIEGNSGPYIQYAYARTQSLLGKASEPHSEAKLHEN